MLKLRIHPGYTVTTPVTAEHPVPTSIVVSNTGEAAHAIAPAHLSRGQVETTIWRIFGVQVRATKYKDCWTALIWKREGEEEEKAA